MKDQIKSEIAKILQAFFQEEQNNRVTSNNMNGLNGKFMAMVDGLLENPPKGTFRNPDKK